MEDYSDQNTERADDSSQPSELVDRLLRRQTESPGVIDVRHSQQHYERTAMWIAERFALLGQLNNRYGFAESHSPHGQAIVMQQPLSRKINALSGSYQSQRPAATSIARSVKPDTDIPPPAPGGLRISRRSAQLALKADSTASAKQEPRKDSNPSSASPSPSSKAINQTPHSLVFPKRIDGRANNEPVTKRTGEPTRDADESSSPLPTSTQITDPVQTAAYAVAEKTEPGANTRPAAPSAVMRISRKPSTPAKPLVLQKRPLDKPDEQQERPRISAASERPRDETRGAVSNAAIESRRTPSPPPLPLIKPVVKPKAASSQVQRTPSKNRPSAQQETEKRSDIKEDRKPAVAAEIRRDPVQFPKPAIIWRKSANARAATEPKATDSNSMLIARKPDNSVSASESSQSSQIIKHAAAGQALAGEINPDKIAEQVIRSIFRRLLVERERRGIEK